MVFTEIQKFNPIFMWVFRLILIGLFVLVLYLPVLREPSAAFAIIVVPLLIWVLFEVVKLSVQIDQEGISMHMRPFTRKSYSWSEIETTEVIDYGFIGGWGVRITKLYGIVYNTRGSKGILIRLKNGKKFVIGIQSDDEAKRIISNYT